MLNDLTYKYRMKKAIASLGLVLLTIYSNAQLITLHSSSGVKLFKGSTALSDSYAAAESGDTLYLSGSSFVPPAAFDKKLLIYGAGHYVDSTLATGKTVISGNVVLNENADGFHIEGVEVTGSFSVSSNQSVNQLIVKWSKINGTFNVPGESNPSVNIAVIGSVIVGNIDLTNAQAVLFSNSILQGQTVSTNNNNFANCFLLNNASGSSGSATPIYGDNNTIRNCVFRKDSYWFMITGTGNTFSHNLFVHAAPTFGSSPTLLDNWSGVAQSAIFLNQTGYVFSYAHNYHLQSPSSYIGDDDTEVGIYGGAFPYKDGGVPSNPHISSKTIGAKTNSSGLLNVNIRVNAQDN